MASLHFRDFRPMEPGDKGKWYKDGHRVTFKDMPKRGRWMYSPSSHKVLSQRQYQREARGGLSYTEYAVKREEQGIQKREYRTPGHTSIRPRTREPSKRDRFIGGERRRAPPKPAPLSERIHKMLKNREAAERRKDILQEGWAKKRSEEYGVQLTFDELPDVDQTAFWHYYHEVVEDTMPESYEEFEEEYSDYFDIDYDDWYDIEYGSTP